MAEPLDIFRYVGYLRFRWQWIAASCAVAVGLAAAVSFLQTREYTATARIVIEPPAGSDSRSAVAVSPIYLESLKTYEQFAGGDSLFQKAVDKFQLRSTFGPRPIESLKKRMVKVGVVRNTRILEIAATLPDPKQAQALARYLAECTVELSRSVVNDGDQDLLQQVDQQQREIRASLDAIEVSWSHLLTEEPVADLQSAMSKTAELRLTLQQQILSAEQEVADAAERQKSDGTEAAEARKESSNATARLAEMHKQLDALDAAATQREKLLAIRISHRDSLEAERKAAQSALAAVETRAREARAEAGYRGERLRIIDPGVVPERPSSPNLGLNIVAALLLGLTLPVLYLILELDYKERSVLARRPRHAA